MIFKAFDQANVGGHPQDDVPCEVRIRCSPYSAVEEGATNVTRSLSTQLRLISSVICTRFANHRNIQHEFRSPSNSTIRLCYGSCSPQSCNTPIWTQCYSNQKAHEAYLSYPRLEGHSLIACTSHMYLQSQLLTLGTRKWCLSKKGTIAGEGCHYVLVSRRKNGHSICFFSACRSSLLLPTVKS